MGSWEQELLLFLWYLIISDIWHLEEVHVFLTRNVSDDSALSFSKENMWDSSGY